MPAAPGDGPALTELAIRSKAHWGYPAEWLAEWRPLLTITEELIASAPVFGARLGAPRAGEAGSAGQLGFYVLDVTGETASLEHLWVDPPAMGRGVGRALFRHAAKRAACLGCRVLQVDSDPNAEPFYVAMGAVRVGTVPAPVVGQRRELPRLYLHLAGAGGCYGPSGA